LPTSLRDDPDDDPELAERKRLTREEFSEAFRGTEARYARLLSIWDMEAGDRNFDYKKKVTSCLCRIVPMGVATGGVWTGNVRSLRHVIAMRAAPAAEEEIFHVFSRIAEDVIASQPLLFGDFKRGDDGSFSPEYWKV
jgi:thymidylate synthase (FAD)